MPKRWVTFSGAFQPSSNDTMTCPARLRATVTGSCASGFRMNTRGASSTPESACHRATYTSCGQLPLRSGPRGGRPELLKNTFIVPAAAAGTAPMPCMKRRRSPSPWPAATAGVSRASRASAGRRRDRKADGFKRDLLGGASRGRKRLGSRRAGKLLRPLGETVRGSARNYWPRQSSFRPACRCHEARAEPIPPSLPERSRSRPGPALRRVRPISENNMKQRVGARWRTEVQEAMCSVQRRSGWSRDDLVNRVPREQLVAA